MITQFGLFGICDGHGGAAAAISASKLVLHFPFWRFYFGTINKVLRMHVWPLKNILLCCNLSYINLIHIAKSAPAA